MSTFQNFLANLDGWDIGAIILGSWVIVAVLLAPVIGRAMRDEDEIRQPEIRSWLCSDGYYRTAAESADWTAATDGAWARRLPDDWDATALPEWINDHGTVPDYVPQEWVA